MKVLLINPPMQINLKPEIPSFGLFYVLSELKKHGHEVALLDIDAYRYPKIEVTQMLQKSDARIVGIGGLVTVFPYLQWLLPQIKQHMPKAKIILGGPVASSLKEHCFESCAIDFAVIGEGEVSMLELLTQIERENNYSAVAGIGFRDANNKVIFTDNRPLMSTLDHLPRLDETLFPMEALLKNTGGVMQIHAQRGCPSACTFCFNGFRVAGKDVRYRPVAHVIDEIAYFKNKYQNTIKLFAISGECITMNKAWILDFCQELLHRKLDIKYRVTSRVDTIDAQRLHWLKKSGCRTISLGLESGSDRILRIMRKGSTSLMGLKAVAMIKKYIKDIEACIILGYRGENRETLRETVTFCKKIGVYPSIFFATAFPGTQLYKEAVEKGKIKDERTYLMSLDTLLTSRPSINLTDMPDQQARQAIRKAVRQIRTHYYVRQPGLAIEMCRRIVDTIKKRGLRQTLSKIYEQA